MANFISLKQFAKSFVKTSVASLVNKETGEQFNALMFTDNEGTNHCCYFAKALGNLNAVQVSAQKDDLYVVKGDDGHLYCCKGNNNWEEVAL